MTMEYYRHVMDIVGTGVDGVGVFIVVSGAIVATVARTPSRAEHRQLLLTLPAGCRTRDFAWSPVPYCW